MAVVTVTSLQEIFVDGKSAGSALDVARNRPEIGSDVQRAIETWAKDVADNTESAFAAKDADKKTALEAAKKASDDALAAKDAAAAAAKQASDAALAAKEAEKAQLVIDHKAAMDKTIADAKKVLDDTVASKDTEKAQALSGANDIKQAEIASIELRAAADLTAKEAERSAAQIKADEAGAKATQLAADKAATDAANAKLLASLQSVAKTPEYLAKLQADKDAVIKQQQATDAAKAALVAEQAKIDAEIAANTKP